MQTTLVEQKSWAEGHLCFECGKPCVPGEWIAFSNAKAYDPQSPDSYIRYYPVALHRRCMLSLLEDMPVSETRTRQELVEKVKELLDA